MTAAAVGLACGLLLAPFDLLSAADLSVAAAALATSADGIATFGCRKRNDHNAIAGFFHHSPSVAGDGRICACGSPRRLKSTSKSQIANALRIERRALINRRVVEVVNVLLALVAPSKFSEMDERKNSERTRTKCRPSPWRCSVRCCSCAPACGRVRIDRRARCGK